MICKHRCASGSVDRIDRVVHVRATRLSQDDLEVEVGSACSAISGTKDAWKRKWLRRERECERKVRWSERER